MKLDQFSRNLKPTPAKLFFVALIATGWTIMIAHPAQLMIHHMGDMGWMPADFAKALAMWGIMVLAMMVPTLAPLYRTEDRDRLGFNKTTRFILGYLLAWTGFCVAATALQYGLRSHALLNMHDTSTSIWFSALLLIGAGVFQLTNTKQVQIKACQLSLKRVRSSSETESLVASGVNYGADCIKCCWPMMLTMFVFGLMNIAAMFVLTLIMVAEKSVPQTVLFARLIGALFLAAGLIVLLF